MCGIVGVVHYNHGGTSEKAVVQKMCETLQHRGPDGEGVWFDQHALLGHRRLAVIDVERGAQPMKRTVNEQTYVLTYNGELYNTIELKEQLVSRGYHFETTSDTEVLLYAFIEWREQVVNFLNGIYAFAVWDAQEETLYAFRDRLGVKPFYFAVCNGQFSFASEIKALLVNPLLSTAVTREGLASLLSLGPSHTPGKPVYRDIEELQPAHALKWSRHGCKIWCYWSPEKNRHEEDEQQTIIKVRSLLLDAIERQLVSDVPLCTFLSGGIDSSVITAVAANHFQRQGKQLHTFSVDYENHAQSFEMNEFQGSRDQHWVQRMSRFSNTKHHDVVLQTDDLLASLHEGLLLKDMPSMADIDSSLYLFSKEIKAHFTVALSGECADELFGGYRWFYEDFDGFPWIRSIEAREQLLNESWREKLQLADYLEATYASAIKEMPIFDENPVENKRQQLFLLNRQYFMQTLLERKDRMTMGAGLEVRVPFADHRLVEYVWNIPWHMKITGNLEKGLLRKAAEGLVPNEVLYRKKNPYPKTYDARYTDGVAQLLAHSLGNKDSILHELFDEASLQQLIETRGASFTQPWFGQLMAGPQLLAYLAQFHHWVEAYGINFVSE